MGDQLAVVAEADVEAQHAQHLVRLFKQFGRLFAAGRTGKLFIQRKGLIFKPGGQAKTLVLGEPIGVLQQSEDEIIELGKYWRLLLHGRLIPFIIIGPGPLKWPGAVPRYRHDWHD